MRTFPLAAITIAALSLSAIAAHAEGPAATAADSPRYVAPPPTGDPKSTIISGILMIVNGVIMSEADRRHQERATFVTVLNQNGLPILRQACRAPERN